MTRKHATPVFWLTVALVVVLLGYPLSFGPAYWATDQIENPDWAIEALRNSYAPIYWTYENGPKWVRNLIDFYLDVWR